MITKETAVDQITISENGIVMYREATRIKEDGNLLTQTYHRTSLTPGQDLSNQPEKVVAVCNTVWTSEVVAAYQAEQTKTKQKIIDVSAAAARIL